MQKRTKEREMIFIYNPRSDELFTLSSEYYAKFGIEINEAPYLTDIYVGF